MTTEIRRFFEDYAKTYDEFDVARMSTYANCPLITVFDGEPTCHDDSTEVENFFSRLLEWFREIGLGGKSAFASVLWRSTRADESAFLEWPTAYQLIKLSGEWKILVIVLRYEAAQTTSLS